MGKQLNEHSQFYWVMREAGAKVLGVLSTAFMAAALVSLWVSNLERRYNSEIASLQEANEKLTKEVAGIKAALAPLKTTPMKASWYGPGFHGRKTASGEIFDKRKLTVAHRTLPIGAYIIMQNGKYSAVGRVNDYGPASHTGRDLDVSERVAELLGMKEAGEATLQVRRLR